MLSRFPTWVRVVGWVLNGLIGALLLFAGSMKVFGSAPPELVENMAKLGLSGQMKLIGAGELLTALLLLIPRTVSLGVLLASGFWGGVICAHMTQHETYIPWALALILTWAGAFLRDPRVLGSVFGPPQALPDRVVSPVVGSS